VADEVLRIRKVSDRPGLVIAGEVDESGYPVLVQCLAALGTHDEVHIDLGGVEFCDLAGLRAIVSVGRPDEDASPGRHVCLHAVPPRLRKILDILGWEDAPGLAFDESSLAAGPAPACLAEPSAPAGTAEPAGPAGPAGPAPDEERPAIA
jgi:ABC-type transporter Mla MlaB component